MEELEAYGWRKAASVEEGLFREGHRFDFYQAVRLLETLFPDKESPGEALSPERELVRFSSAIGLDFPPTDVDRVRPPEGPKEPASMAVNFLGLAGGLGPLPRVFSELVVQRVWKKDSAFRDFLDLFNHRLVSILYRARKRYRPAIHWQSPEKAPANRSLFALMGIGTNGLQERLELPDRSLLPYSGLLARVPRTMVGLERMLAHQFGVGASLSPMRGRWLVLSEDQVTRIGRSGQNQRLGRGAVLGSRVWDQAAAFELTLGPMKLERFVDLLPIGSAYPQIRSITRFYVGEDLQYRMRLTLEAEEVPVLRLGRGRNARLGWTTWLKTQPTEVDDSQVTLAGQA